MTGRTVLKKVSWVVEPQRGVPRHDEVSTSFEASTTPDRTSICGAGSPQQLFKGQGFKILMMHVLELQSD